MAPSYEFVEVYLNGNKLGIYALEEHFYGPIDRIP